VLELSPPQPLAYHRSVLAHVRRSDPRAWQSLVPAAHALAGSAVSDPELAEGLLRNTYRLDPDAHPVVCSPSWTPSGWTGSSPASARPPTS